MSGPGQMSVNVLPGMHSQQGGMVSQGGAGMMSQGGGGMVQQGGGMVQQGGGMVQQGGGMVQQGGGMVQQGGGMVQQGGGMVQQGGGMVQQGGGMVQQGSGMVQQGGGMVQQGGGMVQQGGGMVQQGGMISQGGGMVQQTGMISQGGGMVPQVGMVPQSGMMPVQTNPQAAAIQTAEIDPIAKFKSLLPRLKEALVNLFKTGGHLFYQNATQDETGVQYENVSGSFEKSLEEFFALCDQIEICLRLAYEIIQQDRDSSRNTPNPVLSQKNDAPQPEGQLYSQYLSTVRAQISCAKDIRDLLHECLKNFPEHAHP